MRITIVPAAAIGSGWSADCWRNAPFAAQPCLWKYIAAAWADSPVSSDVTLPATSSEKTDGQFLRILLRSGETSQLSQTEPAYPHFGTRSELKFNIYFP